MKTSTFARFRRVLASALPVAIAGLLVVKACAVADPATELIDKLVEEGLKRHNQEPNAPAADDVFLRRVYLDVIGRIPTNNEAAEFLNSTAPDKRAKLIDQLLTSEGYVSNFYNYWADILRIKTDIGNGNNAPAGAGSAYIDWVKTALAKNLPYDQFVKHLVTAEGYVWENGAVGYYMRDAGMPLDNMSNTVQIFLGTRVVCAQCHNHPFDKWTQKDYYEMAAFTYGMETRLRPEDLIPDMQAKEGKISKKQSKKKAYMAMDGGFRKALEDLIEPLSYGANHNPGKMLKLPDDFKYLKEGQPSEEVKAIPIFGEKIGKGKNMLENYADWMTSNQNPTFSVVIANRLWKKLMGVGLIEPADDFKGNDPLTLATNPALMRHLNTQMVANKYDMKRYMRLILNSRTYQREATPKDISPEQYYFQGPILRRMSAEQLWDSVVGLVIPSPDFRKSSNGYKAKLVEMKAKADELKDKISVNGGKQIMELAMSIAKVESTFEAEGAALRKQLAEARKKEDAAGIKSLQAKIEEVDSKKFDARTAVIKEDAAKAAKAKPVSTFGKPAAPAAMKKDDKMAMMDDKNKIFEVSENDERWKGFGGEWIRASELSSPAPNNHFVRMYGQSDREIIDHANTDASVTQALAMLNGPLFDQLMGKDTILAKTLAAAKTVDEKRDALFITLLSRLPNDAEKAMVAKQVAADGAEMAIRKVAWALLATKEFIFVR